jgi:hypothetical protein
VKTEEVSKHRKAELVMELFFGVVSTAKVIFHHIDEKDDLKFETDHF